MSRRLGKYCHIRSVETGHVLEVHGKRSGSPVVSSISRDEDQHNGNQLWYVDIDTNTIRNKLTGYVLDHNQADDRVVVRPFQSSRRAQRWVLIDGLIQTQEDFELVLAVDTEFGSQAYVIENDNSARVMWTLEYRPAQFFFVRSRKLKNKLLDVEKAKEAPGTKVIVWSDKGTTADNQIWYEDQQGIIRSKLTNFVIDANGKEVVLKPYKPGNELQQWFLRDGKIQNWNYPSKVIALQQSRVPLMFYDTVNVVKFTGADHQLWDIEYLQHSAAKYNHGNQGKYFFIKCLWNNVVLSLLNDNKSPGVAVITDYRKEASEDSTTQLFYIDEVTGTLRDKGNDYCLEISDDIMVTNIYNPGAENQQWNIFGKKIQNRSNPSMVLTVQMDSVYENDEEDQSEEMLHCHVISSPFENSGTQHFEVEHIQAGSFFIRNVNSGCLMDVHKAEKSVGAKVIQWEQKQTVSENQLWYEDERGFIRSKLTGYVIQADESDSKMMPYDASNKSQHWVIVGDRIQNKHDPGMVLDVKYQSKWKWVAIVSTSFDGGESQKWSFEPV